MSSHNMGKQPPLALSRDVQAAMQAVAYDLEHRLNGSGETARMRYYFGIIVAEAGPLNSGTKMSWVTNTKTGQMIAALKEFISGFSRRGIHLNG